jgi:O-antigen/teichoic acid export membrane protein
MRLKFFSHLFLMVALNLLVKPLAIFGIDAQVQNIVGPEEYGTYFSLLNFTYLFNIILDLGITNFNIKHIAQHPHLAKNYLGKIIPIRFLLFFIYVLVVLLFSYFLNYNESQQTILWVLIFNQFLIASIFYFRSYFAGLLLLKTEALFSVLDKLLLIFIAGYFILGFSSIQMNMLLFVEIQSICYLLTFLFALGILIYKIGVPKIKWHFSFNQLMLSKSFPYALLIVLMMIYNRVDSVMLERIAGSKEAGIYAQAYRMLDACFMFATLFSSLLFPIFAKMIKQKESIIGLLKSSQQLLITGAIIIAGTCFINAKWILSLIYQQEVEASILVFQLLMLSFIPICLIVIYGTLLTSNGSLKFLNLISFVGICLSILLNLFYINQYGAIGSGLVSLLTQTLLASLQVVYAFKIFKISFSVQMCLKYLGLGISLYACSFLSSIGFKEIGLFICTLVIAVLYAILTHLFEWKLITNLLIEKQTT